MKTHRDFQFGTPKKIRENCEVDKMNEFSGLWIPKEILEKYGLSQTEKLLLAAILALSKTQYCCAGNQYFAKLLGISKHRVSVVI